MAIKVEKVLTMATEAIESFPLPTFIMQGLGLKQDGKSNEALGFTKWFRLFV